MTYLPKRLSLDAKSIKGISEKVLVSHHENNYLGAAKRLAAIGAPLAPLKRGLCQAKQRRLLWRRRKSAFGPEPKWQPRC
jgi:hypothetical protein